MKPLIGRIQAVHVIKNHDRYEVIFYPGDGSSHIPIDGETILSFEKKEGVIGFLLAFLVLNSDVRWVLKSATGFELKRLERYVAELPGEAVAINVLPAWGDPNRLQTLLSQLIDDPRKAMLVT